MKTSEDALLRICVINCPLGEIAGGHGLVHDFIKVLEPLADELFVITRNFPEEIITNNRVHIRNLKHDAKRQPMLIRVFKQALFQLRICFNLIKISARVDIVIFYLGSSSYLLPTLLAKLLRKKIVSVITGSPSKSAKELYAKTVYGCGGVLFSYVLSLLEKINYRFADRIVAESKTIIRHFGLERYEHKIWLSGCFFDTGLFRVKQNFSDRRNLIGYIGRLGEDKGVMNFVRAIPSILNRRDDVEFLIGGDGYLRGRIESELRNDQLYEKVVLTGWIPREQLIHYLNDLKVLVVPSYTESIPIVALEGMACGTPVLATPVGGVPDVIRDEENGFILRDNSTEHIADSVVKALEHPRLEEIARAAYASVERDFTYQAATEKYRIILGHWGTEPKIGDRSTN